MLKAIGNPKLTKLKVQQIRWIRKDTGATYRELGKYFNVTAETIGGIVRRETWQWVEDLPQAEKEAERELE